MPFSLPLKPTQGDVVKLVQYVSKLPKPQRELFSLCLDQQNEASAEAEYHPTVKPHIIKPLKKPNLFLGLSDIEQIVYVCDKIGIGSVRMSAYLGYTDRHIRRIFTVACEKIEAQKQDGNVRFDMYMEGIENKEVITDEEQFHDD